MIKRGDILTLEITGTNIFARGIAKADGMVVFCRGALCGDNVSAVVTDVKKNYAEADCATVITPSPHRASPFCPHADECGGCAFSHITSAHEAEVKRRAVADALRREGIRIDTGAVQFIDTACEGYRNKAVFHFDEKGDVGFFAAGSRNFVKIENCSVVHPAINKVAREAERIIKEDGEIEPSELTYLYIRYMKETDEASVALGYTGGADVRRFASKLSESLPFVKCVTRGVKDAPEAKGERFDAVFGKVAIAASLGGISFDVPPASFFQVNTDGAEALCRTVAEYADLKNGERAADVYCGAGLFALTLAKSAKGAEVYGIEINSGSVSAANATAAKCGVGNVFFVAGDSSELTAKTGVDKFDVAVVDPPRSGLSGKTVSELLSLSPSRIVYVSCNPSTLARDTKLLGGAYSIAGITAVNMFPRTKHVETVVLLSRQ